MKQSYALLALLNLMIAGVILSSCAVDESTLNSDSTGGNGVTTDNGQKGQDIDVEKFVVSFDTNDEITMRWSSDSDNDFVVSASEVGTPCEGVAGGRIQCVLDMDELDIWKKGITMNVELPGDTCAYLMQKHYFYSNSYVGQRPFTVYYLLNPVTGKISGTKYDFDGLGVYNPAAPNSSTGLYDPGQAPGFTTRPWITVDDVGDIRCPWDYTVYYGDDGKNCCPWDYSAVVYNSLDLTDIDYQENLEWGGKFVDCVTGPAKDDELPKIDDGDYEGFPTEVITEVIGKGYGTEYRIPTLSRGGPLVNLYYANYFNPSDHSSSDQECFSSEDFMDNGPSRCAYPLNGLPDYRDFAWPFYSFVCLDHNHDVEMQIDVLVREWNTKSQLLLGASGDPDVVGSEPSPWSPLPKNDYCDWKDFQSGSGICYGFNYSRFSTAIEQFIHKVVRED